jgi:hypothetical protein
VEEQFYIAWPLLLAFAWKRRWNMGWTLIGVAMLSFFAGTVATRFSQANAAFYFPLTRFWEILAGGLLWYSESGKSWTREAKLKYPLIRELAALVATVLLFATLLLVDKETPWPGLLALLPVSATVLIIWAGPTAWINRRILSNRLLVAIGLISYPLYLWHWPLLVYGRILNQEQLPRLGRIGLVLVSFLLAIATYALVEKPIRFGAHKKRSAMFLLPALGAVAVIGLMVQFGLVPARLNGRYTSSVEFAITEELRGGGFNRAGTDIAGPEIPGDTNSTVLFIGDSHALQYMPRIAKLSGERRSDFPKVVFLTYGGCPPMPMVNHRGMSWDGRPWRCPTYYEKVLEHIASPRVKTVVLSAYWDGYLENGSLFSELNPSTGPLTTSGAATDSVFALLERDVARMQTSGKRVFIILANPAAPAFNPHSMLPARLPWLPNKTKVNAISRLDFESRTRQTMDRLRMIAKRTGAIIIDPVPNLCGLSTCPTVTTDDLPINMDDHHLRPSFTRERATFVDVTVSSAQAGH